MATVAGTLLALLLGTVPPGDPPQDATELVWKFRLGQEFRVDWDSDLKIRVSGPSETKSDLKVHMEFGGLLKITKVHENGAAEGDLHFDRYLLSGKHNDTPLEVLIEEKKLLRGPAEVAERLLGAPLRITASREGKFLGSPGHGLSATFGGKGVMFGPWLPGRAVTVGHSWETPMQTGQASLRTGPKFSATVTWKEMKPFEGKRLARLVIDEEKTLDHGSIKVPFTMKSDVLFDVARGAVARMTSHVKGKRTKGDGATTELEMDVRMAFRCDTRTEGKSPKKETPTPEPPPSEEVVRGWIEDLGSPEITKRTTALSLLRGLKEQAKKALLAAKDHPDPEVRLRVKDLLLELVEHKVEDGVLLIEVAVDGTVRSGKKVVTDMKDETQAKAKLRRFFYQYRHRFMKKEGLTREEETKYPILIRAERSTPFEHIQTVLMIGTHLGAVTKVELKKDSPKK